MPKVVLVRVKLVKLVVVEGYPNAKVGDILEVPEVVAMWMGVSRSAKPTTRKPTNRALPKGYVVPTWRVVSDEVEFEETEETEETEEAEETAEETE